MDGRKNIKMEHYDHIVGNDFRNSKWASNMAKESRISFRTTKIVENRLEFQGS